MSVTIKENQKITLQIKRLGINGEGIGYYQKMIVFVEGALPKETVQVKIKKNSGNFLQGDLISVIEKAANRIDSPCSVYEDCGGCQLQHLSYSGQLQFKTDVLKQSLQKFRPEGYKKYKIKPTIGMKNPWQYRNKSQFQVREKNHKVIAGLYQKDSHHLIPIENCLVQHPLTTKAVNTAVKLLEKYQIPIYDERSNSGIVKTIMTRVAIATNEVQLVFITQSKKFPQKNSILRELQQIVPEVVSIMQNIQMKKTSLVMGDHTICLWGKETIKEHLDEVVFDLSARSFFQLNPVQTKILYSEAKKALAVSSSDKIIDAYCGVGTIGLGIAAEAKELRGMDIIPSAIEDAKKNAARMKKKQTLYEVGRAEELIPQWKKNGFQATGLIVDPPRTGLDNRLLTYLCKSPVNKLVYISCNPSTLVRDLVQLSQTYWVDYLQSVDMFPQTARVEVVVKLTKK